MNIQYKKKNTRSAIFWSMNILFGFKKTWHTFQAYLVPVLGTSTGNPWRITLKHEFGKTAVGA
jgi:hypothetical protein